MDKNNNNIDKICKIIKRLVGWLDSLKEVPVAYIGEDTNKLSTRPNTYLEVAYQSEGDPVEIYVKDKMILSEPGTLMLLNAHFGNHATPSSAWSYWCLSLDIGDFNEFAELGQEPLLLNYRLENTDDIVHKYRSIALAKFRKDTFENIRIKTEIISLLCKFYEKLKPGKSNLNLKSKAVEKAVKYIHDNYNNHNLDLKEIAKFAGLSHIHFGRTFKNEMGITPMKYLNSHRIKRAEVLLKRTNIFIGEVGYIVGFNDRLHFSRVFRNYTGKSPRQFRN